MRYYRDLRRGRAATLVKKIYPWLIVKWNLSIRGPEAGSGRRDISIRMLESLMAALIAGYLLSSTCGTLVQGPRSSLLSSQSAAVPETRNPNGGPLCPLPSPPPVRPTVVFADAEEVGRALDDAGFLRRPATFLRCGSLLVTFSSRLLFHSFRGEGRNAGRGERWEKRGRGREREKKERKIGGNFEAKEKRPRKREEEGGAADWFWGRQSEASPPEVPLLRPIASRLGGLLRSY